jgi:uncharacterized membrane protein (DUF4010 family)
MATSSMGYVAQRIFGPRFGLPLSGFASGFISSAATVSAMGHRSMQEEALFRPAVAGATLSTVSTIIQMAALLLITNAATLRVMAFPLAGSGLAALAYGLWFTTESIRGKPPEHVERGRPFKLTSAVGFAAAIAAILLVSAAVHRWLGATGLLIASAIAGFGDAHSPAIAMATMAAAGKIAPDQTLLPILLAMTANSATKGVLAITSGNRKFAAVVIPGLVLVVVALWGGALLFWKWRP